MHIAANVMTCIVVDIELISEGVLFLCHVLRCPSLSFFCLFIFLALIVIFEVSLSYTLYYDYHYM